MKKIKTGTVIVIAIAIVIGSAIANGISSFFDLGEEGLITGTNIIGFMIVVFASIITLVYLQMWFELKTNEPKKVRKEEQKIRKPDAK